MHLRLWGQRRRQRRLEERLRDQRWVRERWREQDSGPPMGWRNVTLTATDVMVMERDGTWRPLTDADAAVFATAVGG